MLHRQFHFVGLVRVRRLLLVDGGGGGGKVSIPTLPCQHRGRRVVRGDV
jgi:hypothetical protein